MTPVNNTGMTLEQACRAVSEFAACIPPMVEKDIELVRLNPNLSRLDKFFLIRKMRKQIKYDKAKRG